MPRKKKSKQRRTRGEGCLFLKRGWYYLKYRDQGKTVYEATGTKDEGEAKTKLRDHINEIAKGNPVPRGAHRVTFEDMAEDFINDYVVNGKRSLDVARRRVKKHLARFFGGRKAHDITSADVRAFIAARQEEKAAAGEINLELAALKRMFNLALQVEKIHRKPYIQMLRLNNARQGFFEEHEFLRLLPHLPEELRPPIMFAYWTGWRLKSEILPLTWSQVDFDAGTVRLEPGTTKNREGRLFYMTTDLRALLEQQWSEHLSRYLECPLVFHRKGKRIKDMRGSWDRACRDAGVTGKIPHDFRRTAVRNRVREGTPERVAMQMAGHKTRSVFDRYYIVSAGDLREAARRMETVRTRPMVTTLVTIPSLDGDEKPVSH